MAPNLRKRAFSAMNCDSETGKTVFSITGKSKCALNDDRRSVTVIPDFIAHILDDQVVYIAASGEIPPPQTSQAIKHLCIQSHEALSILREVRPTSLFLDKIDFLHGKKTSPAVDVVVVSDDRSATNGFRWRNDNRLTGEFLILNTREPLENISSLCSRFNKIAFSHRAQISRFSMRDCTPMLCVVYSSAFSPKKQFAALVFENGKLYREYVSKGGSTPSLALNMACCSDLCKNNTDNVHVRRLVLFDLVDLDLLEYDDFLLSFPKLDELYFVAKGICRLPSQSDVRFITGRPVKCCTFVVTDRPETIKFNSRLKLDATDFQNTDYYKRAEVHYISAHTMTVVFILLMAGYDLKYKSFFEACTYM